MSTARSGLTTVECLVALVVFSLGALGAAGTGALALRTAGEGWRASASARVAAARIDSLRLARLPCGVSRSGSRQLPGGIAEQWSAQAAGRGHVVVVVITRAAPRGPVRDSIESYLTCG
jgi:type II secretory pathway pseudopilin PulG